MHYISAQSHLYQVLKHASCVKMNTAFTYEVLNTTGQSQGQSKTIQEKKSERQTRHPKRTSVITAASPVPWEQFPWTWKAAWSRQTVKLRRGKGHTVCGRYWFWKLHLRICIILIKSSLVWVNWVCAPVFLHISMCRGRLTIAPKETTCKKASFILNTIVSGWCQHRAQLEGHMSSYDAE